MQSPNNGGLTREMLRSQEKGTEVDKRTAALYSEQGNLDITELVVIDETTQCEKCQKHDAKGKCFFAKVVQVILPQVKICLITLQ